ncbi:DUF1853 domain-containing protein, partial [Burkholderia vietnamiensis]|nr:DUF1853 domain-containing protein [Burkholderia vietnamiensis]
PRRLAPDAAPEALADTSGVPSALTARQAPALIGVYRQRNDRLWRETARGFIVPDDWPARAVAFAAPDR